MVGTSYLLGLAAIYRRVKTRWLNRRRRPNGFPLLDSNRRLETGTDPAAITSALPGNEMESPAAPAKFD
jgi:hypothetical protein